jgi:hypothetical protein
LEGSCDEEDGFVVRGCVEGAHCLRGRLGAGVSRMFGGREEFSIGAAGKFGIGGRDRRLRWRNY